jgi:hypothetical protein
MLANADTVLVQCEKLSGFGLINEQKNNLAKSKSARKLILWYKTKLIPDRDLKKGRNQKDRKMEMKEQAGQTG